MHYICQVHQVKYMYINASFNKCQMCLPGQRAILQGLWCVSGPSQGLPPYWGGVHDLVRVLWPRPHVNEHKLHGDHSSQTPCTVIKQRSFSHKESKSKTSFCIIKKRNHQIQYGEILKTHSPQNSYQHKLLNLICKCIKITKLYVLLFYSWTKNFKLFPF